MTSYQIDFTILRRDDGDDEYKEIGFGGATGAATVDDAAYAVETVIQRREWETSPGMPDPEEVDPSDA